MAVPPVARSTPSRVNNELIASVNPAADAVICLLAPASLHSTLVNVAVPLPAAAPISRAVVPSSEPEPAVRARETLKLAGKPTLDVLPYASWALTTGWVASGEPVRVPPGWVVHTNWLAVAGLTTILAEVALVSPLAVTLSVIVVTTVWDR